MKFFDVAIITCALLFVVVARAVAGPSCPQLKICSEAIDVSERLNLDTCLAKKSPEISFSLRASIDVIKKAFSGDLKANYDDAVRASAKLNDELQRPENAEIRKCLEDLRSIVNSCMKKATDQCLASSAYPPGIELRFRMTFKNISSDVFDGNRISMNYIEPEHYENPAYPDLDNSGWYHDKVYMQAPDGQFNAKIKRRTKNSYDPSRQKYILFETPICLQWTSTPPKRRPSPVAFYNCREGTPMGNCVADQSDVGWLELCKSKGAFNWPFIDLVDRAHAEPTPASEWVVPSLNTLSRWRKEYLVGFTKFEITATNTSRIEADRVAFHTRVNGAELLIDGIEGKHQTRPFVPGSMPRFSFGVQSLNLDGRVAGCNLIEVGIFYMRGSAIVAHQTLKENFVAMRQVSPIEETVDGVTYRWTGEYIRPEHGPENMVFVHSTKASSFDEEQLTNALDEIKAAKLRFDAAGLQFEGQQLVGVIRPPLSLPSYGLGVAVVEPTGQLRFVFSDAEASKIQAYLLKLRASADIAPFVDQDTYYYPEKKDDIREGICPRT
ncbi:MAG: hypothetical protein HYS06_03450 [Methylocystis sp.]|nr:hypothetical protein [Methylocystis sp.]